LKFSAYRYDSSLDPFHGMIVTSSGKGNIMPTGACGINCDVCKLRLLGICSSCGSGKSNEALKKLEAQKRIFGSACTILECARTNQIAYCLRDCNLFPCENFRLGPYPFAQSFLDMQERRRQEHPPALDHNKRPINVPHELWEKLKARDFNQLMNLTLAQTESRDVLRFHSLNEDVLIDTESKCLKRHTGVKWIKTDDPMLELVTLLYFTGVKSFHPLGKDLVSTKDLKEAHYFKGHHQLNLAPLVERYSDDMTGFNEAAEYLEGTSLEMGDSAYMLLPFPRVPLYCLYWKGDEEFEPKISVLFDRSIEDHFLASGIWALVNMVSIALLRGANPLKS